MIEILESGKVPGFVEEPEPPDTAALHDALRELAASEQRWHALLEQASDGVFVADERLRLVEVNAAACEMLGFSRAELLQMTVPDLGDPEDLEAQGLNLAAMRRGETARTRRKMRRKDGTAFLAAVSARFVRELGVYHAIARDVSEQVELEAQLSRAQRMEAVGRLAGGIAHDFNNMLSVILNYAEIGRREVAPGSTAEMAFVQIVEAARRSADMTRQLLSFSKHQLIEAETLDAVDAVQRTNDLLRGTLGEQVVLSHVAATQPLWVRIPRSQLEQVLVNLALNARDAMPKGGELVFETRRAPEEPHVQIVVRDTGCGMAPEVLEHAFEPFYSTKARGESSGLGLSMVYGIVTRSGGSIDIESRLGSGTQVTLRLPEVEAPPVRPDVPAPEALARGRGEHVLVVEDEPAVRSLVLSVLGGHDYRARAVTPSEALALADGNALIDLLVTDVVMPRMNGRELAREMISRRPELAVVYMSGYTDDAIDGLDQGDAFVAKPFTRDELLRAVQSALRRRREG